MFEIFYRIIDKPENLESLAEAPFNSGDVQGFFGMNVNGYHDGHYHNYPLQPAESAAGGENLSYRFIDFINAYNQLCRSGYVLINDVESYIAWIELKNVQNRVRINLVRAEKPQGTTELRTTPLDEFEYGNWYIQQVRNGVIHSELVDRRDESVSIRRFRDELLWKSSQYLEELREINPKLLSNRLIAELNMLVAQLKISM